MLDKLETLIEMGLTKNEAKVYLSLLGQKESLAGLIAKKANIHRKNVYDVLASLLKKGFVNVIEKNGKKYWTALSPAKIKEILEERQNKLDNILPGLLRDFSTNEEKRKVVYFEGVDGIKSFLQDIIKTKKKLFVLAGTGKGYSKMGFFIFPWFKQLNKNKISARVLFNHSSSERKKIINEIKNLEYKILPRDFNSATQLFIYGNKTGILIWSETPVCILLDNSEITKGFKSYFELYWKISKK